MANVIKLKRGSGSDPSTSDLVVGEVAVRTDNGKLFTKKDNGTIAEISGSGGGAASNFFINTLSSSSGSGGGSASFNGTATRFTLSNPPSVSAQQLLVSVNGVVQKPNSGTSPSEGFAIDGNDIIFASAPATGAGFFIITYAELAVGVPSDNSVTSAKIADGAIVNGDVSSTAAIAGSKISPDFGSQNIVTTGNLELGALPNTVTNSLLKIAIQDTDGTFKSDDTVKINPAQNVLNVNGLNIGSTQIRTNNTEELVLTTGSGNGTTDIKVNPTQITLKGNVDVTSGIDVTGNITVTGTVDGVDVAALSTSNAAKMPLTGGTFTGNVTSQKIVPVNDSQFDIGENATRFANGYFDTLYGDGSNLTGITSTTINNNADNRVITGSGTANTLNGESTLLFHNGRLDVTQTTSSSDSKVVIRNSNTPGSGSLRLEFQYGTGNTEGTDRFRFGYVEGFRAGGSNDGGLIFGTKPSNAGAPTERMRIDSAGNVTVKTNDVALSGSGTLRINSGSTAGALNLDGGSSNHGGEINLTGGSNGGRIQFRTGQGSGQQSEKMRIDENGRVGINQTNPDRCKLHVVGDDTDGDIVAKFKSGGGGANSTSFIALISGYPDTGGDLEGHAYIGCKRAGAGNNSRLIFQTYGGGSSLSTKMTISEGGNIGAPSGTNIYNASDERLKKNVVDIDKGLSAIKSLRPVSFNWIDGFCDEEKETLYGFIAQEVQAVDTNLIQNFSQELIVNENTINDVLRVNEKFIIPMLVKAVQELTAKVEALEAG